MVDRAFWIPEYNFTAEQRDLLQQDMQDPEDRASLYLAQVEGRTRIFLAERTNLLAAPVQRPKALRESLEGLESLAAQLYDRIENLDALGDEAEIFHSLAIMNQPGDFLRRLQDQLGALRVAAGGALYRVPEPSRGRPPSDHRISFIAELAVDYERLSGQLPPSAREGWFCRFVDSLFSILPGGDEEALPQHYRLVAEALNRIRILRQKYSQA